MTNRPPLIVRYEWSEGARIGADANAVATQLAALTTPDGALALEDVIDANSAPGTPLHDYIEWDDPTAAHLYRLRQAGHAVSQLRRVPVSLDTEEELPAERVYIPRRVVQSSDDEREPYTYVPIAVAHSDAEQFDRIRTRALDRVERLVNEFKSIRVLSELAGDLEDLLLKYR